MGDPSPSCPIECTLPLPTAFCPLHCLLCLKALWPPSPSSFLLLLGMNFPLLNQSGPCVDCVFLHPVILQSMAFLLTTFYSNDDLLNSHNASGQHVLSTDASGHGNSVLDGCLEHCLQEGRDHVVSCSLLSPFPCLGQCQAHTRSLANVGLKSPQKETSKYFLA